MPRYADIAFPTAVRRNFTYRIPETFKKHIQPGMRVWVPLRQQKAIGMVVKVHSEKPDFKTRPIKKILDEQPVMNAEMLKLTHWIHRFYYASWGETIQAALPVGLNFYSESYIQVGEQQSLMGLSGKAKIIYDEVSDKGEYSLKDAERRWSDSGEQDTLAKMIKQGLLEVWEKPSLKVKPKMEKLWSWAGGIADKAIEHCITDNSRPDDKPKWIEALELLRTLDLPEIQPELTKYELLEYYTLHRIEEEGLIKVEEVPAHKIKPRLEYDPSQIKTLNDEQQAAYDEIIDAIENEKFSNYLLYGVTGSGKTEVYIHALKKVMDRGKGGLILVPEIGLTPQTVRRFYQIFGNEIAVLHSRLSERERYDAWQALRKGEKRVAIGARSAVFAPVQNLGLLIVDEEHDSSYKQEDPAPRYHARDVAIMRAYLNDGVVVMGSATPSMVALHGARNGKSRLLKLSSRHASATLPEVNVIDLKQYRYAMEGPLAVPLYDDIEKVVSRGEQVILLYNRRGHSSYLQCEECGQIEECPRCSVSLTYHKKGNQLRCHYCGYAVHAPDVCSHCKSDHLSKGGSGTQKVEEEIEQLFPDARILRMDQDTTTGKNAHEEILTKFDQHKADILLGTQIVAKGLDFPNVTLVGVVNADTELAFPSFRSGERMYQLLSQVAGRSGRAEKKGKVYFQTWQPGHPAIQCAKKHDHERFARQELAFRKPLLYPPYSRLLAFYFKSKDGSLVQKVAEAFTRCLVEAGGGASVLGPSPSAISRVWNEYRWECILKIDPSNGAGTIERLIDETFKRYEGAKPDGASRVRITVNVDAIS